MIVYGKLTLATDRSQQMNAYGHKVADLCAIVPSSSSGLNCTIIELTEVIFVNLFGCGASIPIVLICYRDRSLLTLVCSREACADTYYILFPKR